MSVELINAGFVRQRRFLIGVSIALACVNYLPLTLETINVLGNTANIGNPDRVVLLAYIVWLWAYARYIQWFNDCGAWAETKNAYNSIYELILQRAMRGHPPDITADIQGAINALAKRYWGQEQIRGEPPNLKFSTTPECSKHLDGRPVAMTFVVKGYISEGPQIATTFGDTRVNQMIPAKYLGKRFRFTTLMRVVLGRRYFFEYFAPFLIGLLPLVPIAPTIMARMKALF